MRREFTTKTKAAAWERSGGLCEAVSAAGIRCGLPLHYGKYTYDHILPCWLGGEPTLENCQVIGKCCDVPKTAADQGRIAKTKRQRNAHAGIKKPRTILAWRRFNGQIVRATRER